MPKTHLPGHLDSARQTFRRKHALLVLKCYPRLPSNSAADVRPNSSELSYLLYYCSTRQQKISKVGAFLEQKTTHDVWRWQSARVHVTLQILTALLEHKAIGRASGFALIAPSVLRMIREIINGTNDISLIEASTATWDAFCQHQDVAALAADSEYRTLYEEVVRLYGALAKNNSKKLGKSTTPVAHHDATRLRKAGVAAIKSIFSPAELERTWNPVFDSSVASVLSNLRHDLEGQEELHIYLNHLVELSKKSEEEERRIAATNRRQSLTALRTFSGLPEEQDPDPRTAEGTAQDADRIEEEEVGELALDCLKAIFQSQNRAQARGGAIAFMKYIADEEQRYIGAGTSMSIDQWASTLFRLIIAWTPVQDRFVVIVTAVETLVRFPLSSLHDLRIAEVYAKAVLNVLRSDLNLIGLSVIDILLGLIHISVRTVALTGDTSDGGQLISRPTTTSSQKRVAEDLIPYLKECISNLARHVYYSDQVTDLISFILLRVRPDPSQSDQERLGTAAAANGEVKTSTASLSQRPPTQARSPVNGTFCTEQGRQLALEIVKDVIDVAKSTQQYSAGSAVINRNRVPLGVWEGSQWLLQDPSESVRNAYKDALLEWANNESDEGDAALIDFEAEDCIERLAETKKPASVHGSVGQSHRSAHPQLLMLPATGLERRMSSGKNSSDGTEEAAKPRVRARDLKDIIDGKRFVTPRKTGGGEPVDVNALLATIKVDPSRNGLSMAPPY